MIRLVGAVLAEQDDEWAEGRRYLGLDLLGRCRLTVLPWEGGQAVPALAETASEVSTDLTMHPWLDPHRGRDRVLGHTG